MLLLEALFPRLCCHCQKPGSLLCEQCYEQIEFSNQFSDMTQDNQIFSATQFNEITQSVIHTLKYKNVKEVAVLCARIMYITCLFPDVDVITAIPIHTYRLNIRGFNQAEVIAQELAPLLHVPYRRLLTKTKPVSQLAKVPNKNSRISLVSHSFQIQGTFSLEQKKVLLIDDVWTTGATLETAANILKKHGAHLVYGYTFTHGV